MSNVSKTAIDARFQSLIESSTSTPLTSSNEQLSLLAYGARRANTELPSYTNFAGLPILSQTPVSNGQIVYVREVGAPVTVTGSCYIGLDGRPLSITRANAIYGWGQNCCGATGIGTTIPAFLNTREVSSSTNWCSVSAGSCHTVGLKTDGTLWSWGNNGCGQVGTADFVCYSSPVRELTSSNNWRAISAGGTHTAAIKTDGALWMWGNNVCGQLGDGSIIIRVSPVREGTVSNNWCAISAGLDTTAAIKTDGSLWMWGSGACGKLALNSVTSRSIPTREISSASNWTQVSSGPCHTAAIKGDGSLWSWGSNICAPLGDNTIVDKSSPVREISADSTWCQVSAGILYTSAIKTNGSLWAWGFNATGQLGDGNSSTYTGTGGVRCSPVREFTSSTSWSRVCAGDYRTFAIDTSGRLYAAGVSGSCSLVNNGGDNTVTGTCCYCAVFTQIKYYTGWQGISISPHTAVDSNAAGIVSSACIPGK